ncbi:MAG: T9SS type A sorting domain-containing protein [Saprospiraceae bacterium]|nr:T9SS type A sorting domain-containing protein [Candidatus Opimibacter skivensis]
MKFTYLFFLLLHSISLSGQSYTSYFTGNINDSIVSAAGGVCMMGGASEHDEAMKWFLQRCNGGDVLVLRASGSNGYNAYMYSQLGVDINSVETIVCNSPDASFDPYVHQQINQAEGIWFAGGDQWDYVSYWRNTPVDSLINLAITERNIVIGGTSAGMAILGGFYFNAKNGTVTSSAAMANPYSSRVTVDSTSFLTVPFMDDVITDTHYDNPDRKGRQITFLARILTDWGIEAKGIACDEYTAVCIGTDGIAQVYGDYPGNDDNAWFIQTNCELDLRTPEKCIIGSPLIWDRNETALKVYNIKGTNSGTNTFDLNTWTKGNGGEWQNWYVTNGTVNDSESDRIHCQPTQTEFIALDDEAFRIYPNPFHDGSIVIEYNGTGPEVIILSSMDGTEVLREHQPGVYTTMLTPDKLPAGIYMISLHFRHIIHTRKLIVY